MTRIWMAIAFAGLLSPATAFAQDAGRPEPGWASSAGILDRTISQRSPILPEQLADREAIREALILWGIGIDEDNNDLKRSVLTEDATLIGYIGNGEPVITMTPREEVISGMNAHFERQGDQRRHSVTNIVIQNLSESNATAFAYSIVPATKDGRTMLASAVVYAAKLVRCDDGIWRIKELKVAIDAGSSSEIDELKEVLGEGENKSN